MKQKLTDLKGEIGSSKIIVEYLQTLLSLMNRTAK